VLTIMGPHPDLVDAAREMIAGGHAGDFLREVEREVPECWELAITRRHPLPTCYSWLFEVYPDSDVELYVVFRRKAPEKQKSKKAQHSY